MVGLRWRAALVYPTEVPEDLSLVRLYRRWLTAAGWEVVLGSPYNLRRGPDGALELFGKPVSLVLRHYKTDWWGERESAWLDEELADREPLRGPLEVLLGAVSERRAAVLDPFGAVLTQNKRSMAFFWEHKERFSAASQEALASLVPFTARLERVPRAQLLEERARWVLKSDYGAEGDEVLLGPSTEPAEWERALTVARPGRWVAQRYFEAERDAAGRTVNYGVFVVAGAAAGLYLRQHEGATEDSALSVPCLLGER